jgi:hypothetical protein
VASTLLINRGDPTFAPPLDYFGYTRTVGAPDIGAVEFGAGPAAPAVPVRRRASFASVLVTRTAHRTIVRVRTRNSTRFTLTALVGGRIVAKAAHSGSARAGVRLTLETPPRGRLVIRVRAFGTGGNALRVVNRKAPT